jgi:hypothetical protein
MALPEADVQIGSDADLDGVLTRAVTAAGSRGASLEELWRAAIDVEPELASSPDRRHRLRGALDRLVDAGVVRGLPARRGAYDRSAVPPLPLVVRTVPRVHEERPRAALPSDLRPELASARAVERIRADEVATLEAVNAFLRDWRPGRPDVPVRERSLEIFGNEKRLDTLASTRLFTTGVISLELLHCHVVHPPFVYERISDAPVVLVTENHHTYESARRALGESDRGIGVVAYGAGQAFSASVSYLADLDPTPKTAYYFGDLDVAGLSIARGASEAYERAGGALLEPAVGLYRALLTSGYRRTGPTVAESQAVELVSWLSEELQDAAGAVLRAGLWIPQEAVGYELLARLDDWLN